MEKVVKILSLKESGIQDNSYWNDKSYKDRLQALDIRNDAITCLLNQG